MSNHPLTQEMISAGAAIIRDAMPEVNLSPPSHEEVAQRVYMAMSALAPPYLDLTGLNPFVLAKLKARDVPW